ncbi:uncharacterized protein E0L32_003453 [Thyridium curvatum]|uniref:Duf1237 domain-containing protein n=1 Tax=Thyridium curvatum TaxID=1093900 RepID=A0A507BIQ0_9PEZI|nr:uncharacterized protein E0L32_003453 [Thyridium curvatum]TPX16891.1 hypothetical protein E0L32_003453 [Thyridium curvatum]
MAMLLGGQIRPRIFLLAILLAFSVVFLIWSAPGGSDYGLQQPSNDPPPPPPPAEPPNEASNDESNNVQVGSNGGEEDSYNVPIESRPVEEPVSPTEVAQAGAPVAQTSSAGSVVQAAIPSPTNKCMKFESWLRTKPGPPSEGKRKFPYVRPPPECRSFNLPSMEALITRMKGVIKDPDLFRLFENSYPNTLDTMVKWKGYRNKTRDDGVILQERTDEELTYVITGDIDAMWLRDSASQIYSYRSLLEASNSSDSLASLWRGLINSHSRYIVISPYCHSFQPPAESGIEPTHNGAFHQNNPQPPYNPAKVFDCKWELDSLASFLQISTAYYERTGDAAFFGKYAWIDAVQAAVDAAGAMRKGTYGEDGKVQSSAWTFTGWTNRGSETLTNDGLGNPSRENGMVRSAFRPSDDATIYQFLVPANMMWAKYLEEASHIMDRLTDTDPRAASLTRVMRSHALGIRRGIDAEAVVRHKKFGEVYAYEVDGFGGQNLMDDANLPSLLASPLFNYSRSSVAGGLPEGGRGAEEHDEIYRNTRRFVTSEDNPYWAKGPVLSAVGGPHLGPGKGWPMAAIVAGMTAYDVSRSPERGGSDDGNGTALAQKAVEEEVAAELGQVLDSTGGWGVIHETVNAFSADDWTRAWFGWANGLFGELILRIEEEEKKKKTTTTKVEADGQGGGEGLLERSWQ